MCPQPQDANKLRAKLFKALSDPTRLRAFRLLLERDLCVCELMFVLGMEQSRVSHHMRILREAGLVEDVREGRWVVYRVPEPARPVLEGLLAGVRAGRPEGSAESGSEADLRKLEECVRQNVRGRLCDAGRREVRT